MLALIGVALTIRALDQLVFKASPAQAFGTNSIGAGAEAPAGGLPKRLLISSQNKQPASLKKTTTKKKQPAPDSRWHDPIKHSNLD